VALDPGGLQSDAGSDQLYVRRAGDSEFRAFKVDVIRAQDGRVREVTSFGVDLREAFGVPEVLHG
jgi:RNA polymerase sigma-70 factor (ECF subfamily)